MPDRPPTDRPPTDPRYVSGRGTERAALEIVKLYARAAWLLIKLGTVPLWAPFYIANGLWERRRIRAFILEHSAGQPIRNALIRELTVAWAEQNPKRYPNGQHDRKYNRLKTRFESVAYLIQKSRGY